MLAQLRQSILTFFTDHFGWAAFVGCSFGPVAPVLEGWGYTTFLGDAHRGEGSGAFTSHAVGLPMLAHVMTIVTGGCMCRYRVEKV